MSGQGDLRILAGARALAHIRRHGLRVDDIAAVAAASGGPKWFAVHGLDRAVFSELLDQAAQRVALLGSSSGAWRLACACHPDREAAYARFEGAYREQRYPPKPSPAYISRVARETLAAVFVDDRDAEVLANPRLPLHVVVTRLRGRGGGITLAGAALANLVHRQMMGWAVERVVFHSGAAPTLRFGDGLPTGYYPLTVRNLRTVLLASGSIPRLMTPVNRIPGAPDGVYVDGGVTDYHFDDGFDAGRGLTVVPHFYPYLVPGWFDKPLRRRYSRAARDGWTVVLAPGSRFLERLPGGRIPDRHDFLRLDDAERERRWVQVVAESQRLGDELRELLAAGRVAERTEPL
ncbi:patatin-like phospholipase family protein [Arhodomonas sp. SL1]|uniref:patatin-like phospholipase family protein n=1 Tax=Arhodomonas sp. SL1 TaxID=3425691 RepID=UPI003F883ECF